MPVPVNDWDSANKAVLRLISAGMRETGLSDFCKTLPEFS